MIVTEWIDNCASCENDKNLFTLKWVNSSSYDLERVEVIYNLVSYDSSNNQSVTEGYRRDPCL